jgi:linoleoyl-CoA desaturase
MSKLIFNNRNNEFFQSLKSGVDAYFTENNIKKTGDWRLYSKSIILIGAHLGIYAILMLADVGVVPAIILAAFMGLAGASIGFSVMHDANHGSYSTNSKLNDALGMTANFLGISSYFWKQKHNIIHHTYTNVDGIDDDIAKSPVIRQCDTQKWVPAHKVQHIYLTFIYGLSTIFWIFLMDSTKYFSRKIYTTEAWKMTLKNHLIFWGTKIFYIGYYIVIPTIVWGWQGWLVGWLVMNMVQGIVLSFVFQLAHVVEKTEFEYIPLDTTKHIESAFAEHQLKTTSNFAMENKFISWIVGGLNYQVEHHLFPKVSHVHYPAISKIIQQKCKEYNVPYNYYTTMSEALASHFRMMKRLGERPSEAFLAAQSQQGKAQNQHAKVAA